MSSKYRFRQFFICFFQLKSMFCRLWVSLSSTNLWLRLRSISIWRFRISIFNYLEHVCGWLRRMLRWLINYYDCGSFYNWSLILRNHLDVLLGHTGLLSIQPSNYILMCETLALLKLYMLFRNPLEVVRYLWFGMVLLLHVDLLLSLLTFINSTIGCQINESFVAITFRVCSLLIRIPRRTSWSLFEQSRLTSLF